MNKSEWKAYTELAWVDMIVSSPKEIAQETELYSKTIKENAETETKTLLHLACGAGMNDYTFKKHFEVTGVDISQDMLSLAKELNPEIIYIYGDMRTIELGKKFDAVAIPDSIDYMKTKEDLKKVIRNANKNLNPGGVLLIVAHPKETFKENNFVYTGKKGDIEITVFENNYISPKNDSIYEATIIYLIRKKGKLETHIDIHTLGLFDKKTWFSLLKGEGFEVKETKEEHFYDKHILEGGEYPSHIFVCIKPLKI
ncbi:methyltransferase domain-containing protein [candidate division WOR-3 bacterium]|nr:methyltransferase domain-containing protein [candidate division WOR-3 bacterium]